MSKPRLPAFDPAAIAESNTTSYPAKYRAARRVPSWMRIGRHGTPAMAS
jgi:hypothetical protein